VGKRSSRRGEVYSSVKKEDGEKKPTAPHKEKRRWKVNRSISKLRMTTFRGGVKHSNNKGRKEGEIDRRGVKRKEKLSRTKEGESFGC